MAQPTELPQLLAALVAIDSVNPDLVPEAPGEAQLAHYVAEWLTAAGLEVTLEEAAPGRPNVIGVVRGTGGGRSLMLNAHMDTVGVAGMTAPFIPRLEGNRLYGRGAYDMKGSLAACLLAAARAKAMRLRGDVIVTAVADEEYASIGTAAIVQRWHADAAIVTEPSHLNLCVAHRGFVWLEVETAGIAAHGSRPSLGVDAIAKMGHVLVALEALDQALRAAPTHGLLGSGSLHASLISGGQELSSYPAHCLLAVERRTVPGETPALVVGQIQAIVDRLAAADSQFKATVRTTLVRDPFEIAQDAPLVQLLQRQIEQQLGRVPTIYGDQPWMDTAILATAGIPAVIFGPTGAGAHAVEEWVDLDSVAQCTDVLTATIQEFCA
ncbi:MAG: ArgE/DapE family deacylase [Caldilineaceae bacterium]|nr:ArgE/DapE family deacylase [Caldilineaceae bacterium]